MDLAMEEQEKRMRLPLRSLLLWSPSLALLHDSRVASADEESERRNLLYKIDGRLDYAASELAGLQSDSDASDADDALA